MDDNYMHDDGSVIYVEENIPGPPEDTKEYENLINAFNSQITKSCSCKNECLSNCICQKYLGGQNYTGNENVKNLQFKLNYELKDFKTWPIVECNNLCQCSMKCGNRVVQHGPMGGLLVKHCKQKNKGLGLFTSRFIRNGTFICEYAGEVIRKRQAFMRQNQNKIENKMNYIYCLNEHSNGKIVQTFVDPSKFGNIGRYVNHSCDPNCVIIPVRVNTPIPKLAIFSCMDILPNSELTFDYGSSNVINNPETGKHKSNKKCLCESDKCRGWMPFDVY